MSLIVANWKMNGLLAAASEFLGQINHLSLNSSLKHNVVFLPPIHFLSTLSQAECHPNISLGVQNITHLSPNYGSYTGEFSAQFAKDSRCKYILIGHSERRLHLAETNQIIKKKLEFTIESDLIPILCVGENIDAKNSGKAFEVVKDQLSIIDQSIEQIVIAYEPVYAIGTGNVPQNNDIADMHEFIRQELAKLHVTRTKILYGGSVNSQNAKKLSCIPLVDGLLVGGASLDYHEFWQIVEQTRI